jgi:hypothetical protein
VRAAARLQQRTRAAGAALPRAGCAVAPMRLRRRVAAGSVACACAQRTRGAPDRSRCYAGPLAAALPSVRCARVRRVRAACVQRVEAAAASVSESRTPFGLAGKSGKGLGVRDSTQLRAAAHSAGGASRSSAWLGCNRTCRKTAPARPPERRIS